jgi:hypothetical protein
VRRSFSQQVVTKKVVFARFLLLRQPFMIERTAESRFGSAPLQEQAGRRAC